MLREGLQQWGGLLCSSGMGWVDAPSLLQVKVKSASRGFEPTRDFDRSVTGMSRWVIPLRHGRGCGFKGVRWAGWCVERNFCVRASGCAGAEAAFWHPNEVCCKNGALRDSNPGGRFTSSAP